MLKLLTTMAKSPISVYQGISPALLATMSLSQGIKGSTNEELINSLAKGSIIHSKLLQQCMKDIDRKHFVPGQGINPYQNVPVKISDGQCMTDIFTHAVILERVAERVQTQAWGGRRDIRVLDIGTGHGYIAFVVSRILSKIKEQNIGAKENKFEVVGVDAGQNCIKFCNQLQKNQNFYDSQAVSLQFVEQSVQDLLENDKKGFDLVIGGFYMPPKMQKSLFSAAQTLSNQRKNQYLGIWAAESDNGQSLYTHTFPQSNNSNSNSNPTIKKEEIMATLFSMPTVKTNVSKYFIQNPQSDNHSQKQTQSVDDEQVKQKLLEAKRKQRKDQKQKLQQDLKKLIAVHSKNQASGRLTLAKMRSIGEIKEVLDKLEKFK